MDERDPDERLREGRRQGRVDERLDGIDQHFDDLNGSIAKTAESLQELKDEVTGQRRDILELTSSVREVVPQVRQLVAEGIGTKQVAEALSDRKVAYDSGGDRWRSRVAWTLGLATGVVGLIATAAFVVRLIVG